jgi:hypothetical protein
MENISIKQKMALITDEAGCKGDATAGSLARFAK